MRYGIPAMDEKYVHGYTARESARLVDQATSLSEILHCDIVYPAGSNVLEAGCGVGDLYRITEEDGTFIYTFFKAIALR